MIKIVERITALEELVQGLLSDRIIHAPVVGPVPAGAARVTPDWTQTDLYTEIDRVRQFYEQHEYGRRYPYHAPELVDTLWAELCSKRDDDINWLTQKAETWQSKEIPVPAPRKKQKLMTKAQVQAMTADEQWVIIDETLRLVPIGRKGVPNHGAVERLAESYGLPYNTLKMWRYVAAKVPKDKRPANTKPNKLMKQIQEEMK